MRSQVIDSVSDRSTDDVRELLIAASMDRSSDVSDRALGALRRFRAATLGDYDRALEAKPDPPSTAPWTTALDGRVPVPEGSSASHRLALVQASGGPPAETWLTRWLRNEPIPDDEIDWALHTWRDLLRHDSPRVRRETIGRLSRETDREQARSLLAWSIQSETLPELRIEALLGLGEVRDADARDAVLQAAEDTDPGVRHAAAEALMVVPGRSAEVRLEALRDHDPDPKVRRRARVSLRKRAKAARG
jgi:HEAT repeat protein